MPSNTTTNGSKDKSAQNKTSPKKIVVLKVDFSKLKELSDTMPAPSAPPPVSKAHTPKSTSKTKAASSSEGKSDTMPPPVQEGSETPVQAPSTDTAPGSKRNTPMPSVTEPKPKGKPGPKKKPRLEDGTIDHSAKPVTTNVHPRLGPKANTGFINANLRALDRTGTPCRKWAKKGFTVKSFTGQIWEIPGWKGGDKSLKDNSQQGSSQDVSMPDSSEVKQSESDTAKNSNMGEDGNRMEIPSLPSSPPQIQPAPVLVAT